MTIALIDADIAAFRAAAAEAKDIDWGDGMGVAKSYSPRSSAEMALALVESWTAKAGATTAVCCFSPRSGPTFRHALWSGYKAGRKSKPDTYEGNVQAIEAEYKVLRIDGLEADDVMGITATRAQNPMIVVTLDKDLQGVPGLYFNPLKDLKPRRIAPKVADFYWMMQTLMGDATDGYKGCPGIGKVKAEQALRRTNLTIPTMWPQVVSLYQQKGLTEEDAILQARLARILRNTDYDPENRKVKLWHPTASHTLLSLDQLSSLPETRSSSQPTTQNGRSSRSASSLRTSSRSARGTSSST